MLRRMRNNNLEIRIAGSSCRPQLFSLDSGSCSQISSSWKWPVSTNRTSWKASVTNSNLLPSVRLVWVF